MHDSWTQGCPYRPTRSVPLLQAYKAIVHTVLQCTKPKRRGTAKRPPMSDVTRSKLPLREDHWRGRSPSSRFREDRGVHKRVWPQRNRQLDNFQHHRSTSRHQVRSFRREADEGWPQLHTSRIEESVLQRRNITPESHHNKLQTLWRLADLKQRESSDSGV